MWVSTPVRHHLPMTVVQGSHRAVFIERSCPVLGDRRKMLRITEIPHPRSPKFPTLDHRNSPPLSGAGGLRAWSCCCARNGTSRRGDNFQLRYDPSMTESRLSMRPRERIVGIVIVLVGLMGLIVGFASGHVFVAALCGGLAGISGSVLVFRVLLRTD
jgi:hypothetical protein